MSFIRVIVLAIVFAITTYFLGWMCVPAVGAVYALAIRKPSAPGEAALGALLGWGVLLARVAMVPAFATLLARLGGIFPITGGGVVVLTLVFAMALAWSAARLVTAAVVRGSTWH